MNSANERQTLRPSERWTDESLKWDIEDNRHRALQASTRWKILKRGEATGRIISGNMSTLLLLAGTKYLPGLTGAILCLEDDGTTNTAIIDRYLIQLRHMGVYEQISALIVGRFPNQTGFTEGDPLENVLTIATRGYSFPVVYDVDFGHTDPMMILANGVLARLNAIDNIEFGYMESTVLER